MKTPSPSLSFHSLIEHGLIPASREPQACQVVEEGRVGPLTADPWFVRVLQVVGAWLGAGFFIGFLAVTDVLDNEESALVAGLFLIAVAIGSHWLAVRGARASNLFLEQTLFALSVAGHLLVVVMSGSLYHIWAAPVAAGLLLPITYVLFPTSIHRGFACHFAALTLFAASMERGAPAWNLLTLGLAAVPVGVFYSGRGVRHRVWRPAALAGALLLPGIPLLGMWLMEGWYTREEGLRFQSWVAATLLAATFAWLLWELQRHRGDEKALGLICVGFGAILLGLGGLTEPPLEAAVGLAVLGHMRGDRLLFWTGAASLALGLCLYYYQLDVSLLAKSITLMSLGAALIVAHRALRLPASQVHEPSQA